MPLAKSQASNVTIPVAPPCGQTYSYNSQRSYNIQRSYNSHRSENSQRIENSQKVKISKRSENGFKSDLKR